MDGVCDLCESPDEIFLTHINEPGNEGTGFCCLPCQQKLGGQMILRDLAHSVHEQAKISGFYDDRDPNDPESRLGMIALIHSEISEALECIRSDQWTDYRTEDKPNKPQGLPSEIADVVIRALDFSVFYNIKIIEPLRAVRNAAHISAKKAAAYIADLHQVTTDEDTQVLIQMCYNFAAYCAFDLDNAIRDKISFNRTRPYKHGKTL